MQCYRSANFNGLLASWHQMVKDGATIDDMSLETSRLCKNFLFITLKPQATEFKLYRARKCLSKDYFKLISELNYPQSQIVTKLGRANQVGKPVLYVSQDARTALYECSPQIGDFIAILEYKTKPGRSLNLQHVGFYGNQTIDPSIQKTIGSISARLRSLGYDDRGVSNTNLVHRLLGEEFTRLITPGNENEYAISAAIANFLLRYPECDGLMYPSIRLPCDFNIALKTKAADHLIRPSATYGLEIVGVSLPDIEFRYWCGATSISADGEINWLHGPTLPPLAWNSAGTAALQGPFAPPSAT